MKLTRFILIGIIVFSMLFSDSFRLVQAESLDNEKNAVTIQNGFASSGQDVNNYKNVRITIAGTDTTPADQQGKIHPIVNLEIADMSTGLRTIEKHVLNDVTSKMLVDKQSPFNLFILFNDNVFFYDNSSPGKVYRYDLISKKSKMLFTNPLKNTHFEYALLYPNVNAVVTVENLISGDKKYRTYSLLSGKLLYNGYPNFVASVNVTYNSFAPRPKKGSLIFMKDKLADQSKAVEYTESGLKRQIDYDRLRRGEFQLGGFIYRRDNHTLRIGKHVIQLSDKDELSQDYISPSGKYLLMHQFYLDPNKSKHVKIFDVQNGKAISDQPVKKFRELAFYLGPLWIGDSLFLDDRYLPYGNYMHVPTGLQTLRGNEFKDLSSYSNYYFDALYHYSYDNYLTGSDPYPIKYKGKYLVYSGQGPFRTADGEMQVPVKDVISAIGGSIEISNHNKYIIRRDELSFTLNSKEIINFKGRLLYPLRKLADHLGFSYNMINHEQNGFWEYFELEIKDK